LQQYLQSTIDASIKQSYTNSRRR